MRHTYLQVCGMCDLNAFGKRVKHKTLSKRESTLSAGVVFPERKS